MQVRGMFNIFLLQRKQPYLQKLHSLELLFPSTGFLHSFQVALRYCPWTYLESYCTATEAKSKTS